jgi:REP-associated tyrosine transposase
LPLFLMTVIDKYPWCGHSVLMAKTKQPWQNTVSVYGLFSEKRNEASKRYRAFVGEGIAKGQWPDLTGGGLLRSSGDWIGLKGFRKAGIRVQGDERILGDGDFVDKVLKFTGEALEEKYEPKAKGYDFNRVVFRVVEVMGIRPAQVTAPGITPEIVRARELLCFWVHIKLGESTVEIARRLNLSQLAVIRAWKRGEQFERENLLI